MGDLPALVGEGQRSIALELFGQADVDEAAGGIVKKGRVAAIGPQRVRRVVAKDIVATESDNRVIQRLLPYRLGKVRRLDGGSRFVVVCSRCSGGVLGIAGYGICFDRNGRKKIV